MSKKTLQGILAQLLMFCLFFISNASAFGHLSWLLPEVVFTGAVFWFVLSALSIWILVQRHLLFDLLETLGRNWYIFPFLVFSVLSISWSVYWQISLARWLILVCTIVTGGYLAICYEIKDLVKFLSAFGVFILVFASLLAFFVPHIGVMNYYNIQGAWKGMYWHKNHMGIIAVFVNILFLLETISSFQSRQKQAWVWGAFYLFSILFILQTDSVGSYMTGIFLHGVMLLALIFLKFKERIRGYHYAIFLATTLLLSLVLYLNITSVFAAFGRSTSLTGRIPMWGHLFNVYFSKRMFVGYGFNAFWYIETSRKIMGLLAGYPDPIVIADNGFIDILINTGYVGLALFLVFYVAVWWRSIQYAGRSKDIIGFFPLILMSYTLLANISWSLLFENEGFFMLLMAYVLFAISRRTPVKLDA
jgi:O-antigen ligase